jgi:hypothetical protein
MRERSGDTPPRGHAHPGDDEASRPLATPCCHIGFDQTLNSSVPYMIWYVIYDDERAVYANKNPSD